MPLLAIGFAGSRLRGRDCIYCREQQHNAEAKPPQTFCPHAFAQRVISSFDEPQRPFPPVCRRRARRQTIPLT